MEKKYYRVNEINNDLAVAHPNIAGFSFTTPVELEFENVGFWGEGNTGDPGEKPVRAKKKPTPSSNHIWLRGRELKCSLQTTALSLIP